MASSSTPHHAIPGQGHDDNPSRDILMVSLSRFYSQKNHMQLVIPYISCQSDVSLRLID
jgi:hypothetical protein